MRKCKEHYREWLKGNLQLIARNSGAAGVARIQEAGRQSPDLAAALALDTEFRSLTSLVRGSAGIARARK